MGLLRFPDRAAAAKHSISATMVEVSAQEVDSLHEASHSLEAKLGVAAHGRGVANIDPIKRRPTDPTGPGISHRLRHSPILTANAIMPLLRLCGPPAAQSGQLPSCPRRIWHMRHQAEAAVFQHINGFYNRRSRYLTLGGKRTIQFERKAV